MGLLQASTAAFPPSWRSQSIAAPARSMTNVAAAGNGREVYVKMPVDATTAIDEVEQGARLVAAVAPSIPLFLTPLTEPASPRLTIGPHELERLHAAASRHVADARVLPQLHKVLGIP